MADSDVPRDLGGAALLDGSTGSGRIELLRVLGRDREARSIVDDVVLAIGTEIIEGRLKPGDDLNSVELARSFGSSRTPVREALLTLEREGFVEMSARRRPRVAPLGIREVRDLYELRIALYGMVSRSVVERADESDLDRLQVIQNGLARAVDDSDVDAYFWLNVSFRNTEAALARNNTLSRLLDGLGLRTLQLRHLSLSFPGRLVRSLADHDRLLRAYRDRDAELAVALTQSLVRRGLLAIERSGWTGQTADDVADSWTAEDPTPPGTSRRSDPQSPRPRPEGRADTQKEEP